MPVLVGFQAFRPTSCFVTGDTDAAPQSGAMVSRGFAVASINYRLSGEAIFPAQIYDVKAAIRFLKANALTYSMDTSKFVAAGESDGGGISRACQYFRW